MKQKTNTYMFIELRRHVIILLVMIMTLLFLIIGMSLLNATEQQNTTNIVYGNIILLLIMLVSLLSGISLYRLYNYLFKPLEELHMGFNNIGLMSCNEGSSFKTKDNINRVVMEVKNLFGGISEMMHMIENINMHASFDETLDYIFKTFKKYIPYTYIGIALFRGYGDENVVASYGVCENEHRGLETELLGTVVDINKTSLKRIIEKNRLRVINDLDAYFKNRTISDYSRIIMKHGIKASITLPLLINNKQIGFIFFSSNKKNVYSPLHVDFLKSVSNAIAISFEKNIFVDDLVYSSVLALAKLAEAKDDDTAEHLNRMKKYVVLISNLLKTDSKYSDMIDSKFLIDIEKFSPMHDIGKVGIPDNILLKPGRLTGEEFEIMKLHAVYGADVLKEAEANVMRSGRSIFSEGISIALAHHEKWDGSGYPNGLRGDEIPLSARIVALADVLDALLSRRPYKEPFTFEKSVEIIMDGKGKHFDPHIVDVFAGNIDLFRNMHEQFNS